MVGFWVKFGPIMCNRNVTHQLKFQVSVFSAFRVPRKPLNVKVIKLISK